MTAIVVGPARTGSRPVRPQACPHRPAAPGRAGRAASSCRVEVPAAVRVTRPGRPQPSIWVLRLKVGAVAAIGLLGTVVAIDSLAEQAGPDPQTTVVAGDPGWAHVTGGH